MVNVLSFNDLLVYAQVHGYFLVFLIMIIEGPIMTVAAAFAASLGYFNIWVIFILSGLADLVSDALFYFVGHFTRRKFFDKYTNLFEEKSYLRKIEEKYKEHPGKTIFLLKMSPFAAPGLMAAGAVKVPSKKYIYWNLINNVPRTIFFVAAGYFFGIFAKSILHYYNNIGYYAFFLVVVILVIYFGWKKISNKLLKYDENGKRVLKFKRRKKSKK